MKSKITAKTAKKTQASNPTTKAKRKLVTQKRLSRARRASTSAMADATQTSAPRRLSKKAAIEALVQRKEGAEIADLMAATGWQEHSIRAALTGLRKAGHTISRVRDDSGATRYRICGAA
jgi:hypothetical protein